MTFSIAIPVHNGEKYLKATLASAIGQRRPADEIVVVDDASTDSSLDIVRANEFRDKVRIMTNEQPTGFVDAWNRVIQFSSGDYVTVLHQDDVLDERYLEYVEKAFSQFPSAQHFFSGYYYIDESGKTIKSSPLPHEPTPKLFVGSEYSKEYLRGVASNTHLHRCPGTTTRRSLLVEQCSYRKEAGLIADDDFFIRVGRFTDVIGITNPLASFRIHSESATAKLNSLSYQLANDYLFSLQFHHQHREYLDDEGRAIVAQLASRFVTQLLFEGLMNNNDNWNTTALYLVEKMNLIVPNWKHDHLPSWSQGLWYVMNKTNVFIARLYCQLLETLNAGRKTIFGLPKGE